MATSNSRPPDVLFDENEDVEDVGEGERLVGDGNGVVFVLSLPPSLPVTFVFLALKG